MVFLGFLIEVYVKFIQLALAGAALSAFSCANMEYKKEQDNNPSTAHTIARDITSLEPLGNLPTNTTSKSV